MTASDFNSLFQRLLPRSYERSPSWEDVLQRAARGTPKTESPDVRGRRRLFGLAAVLAAVSLAGVALAGSLDGLADLLSRAEPVPETEMSERDRFALSRMRISLASPRSITRLAVRDGRAYYALRRGGETCYGTGPAGPGEYLLGQVTCARDFPSAERPLLEFALYRGHIDEREPRLGRFAGLAADAVARVGVIDTEGKLHAAPVIGNIYSLPSEDLPNVPVRRVVAFDRDGTKVFDHCVVRGGCQAVTALQAKRAAVLKLIGSRTARPQIQKTFGVPTRKVRRARKECWSYEKREPSFTICYGDSGGISVSFGAPAANEQRRR